MMKRVDQKPIAVLSFCFLLLVLTGFHWWDPVTKWMEQGNTALAEGNLEDAALAYTEAEKALPGDGRILHNKALLAYLKENFDDAADLFDRAATSRDPSIKAQSLYNRGNAFMQQGELQKAVESFVEALKIYPDDEDAKVNLEIALQLMEQMPPPTPQPSDTDDQQEREDQQDTNDQQDDTDAQSADNDTGPDEHQDQVTPTATPESDTESSTELEQDTPTATPASAPPEEQDFHPTPEPSQDGVMSQREAERLLDAQLQDEMEILRRLHQLPQATDIEKKW